MATVSDFNFYIMIGIYKITSPSNKIYIGQSVNIGRRFATYKNLKCESQKILYSSFLKYGVDKHKFEILCECEIHELNDKERYYQDLYSVINNNGMNCRLTTTKDRSGFLSEETKLKLKHVKSLKENHFKGKKHTKESLLKMSKSSSGKFHSEETKIKMSINRKGNNYKLGTKQTEETKIKIAISCKGKKLSENHKATLKLLKSKIVLNLETGIFYESAIYASKVCNIPVARFRNNLNGINKLNKTSFIYV